MAVATLELSVVRFTICVSDTGEHPETHTLIKKGLKIECLLRVINAVANTYKSSIKTKINSVHYQEYAIPIKTGVLEKDIEIYFQDIYDSDYTIFI